jgi:hypothetical protein
VVAFLAQAGNSSSPAVVYRLDGRPYNVSGSNFQGVLGPYPIPASCVRDRMFILYSTSASPNYYCQDTTTPTVAITICVDDDSTNRGNFKLLLTPNKRFFIALIFCSNETLLLMKKIIILLPRIQPKPVVIKAV